MATCLTMMPPRLCAINTIGSLTQVSAGLGRRRALQNLVINVMLKPNRQILAMLQDAVLVNCSEEAYDVGIISICPYSSSGKIRRQKLFRPEYLWSKTFVLRIFPSRSRMSPETMNEYDAKTGQILTQHNWSPQSNFKTRSPLRSVVSSVNLSRWTFIISIRS